uniref:zinc finger protein isoform X1 n=1 Tax=Ciona intestinalis TaxID=7719 RepID=UPI00089DD531|nr:zinc finger protein isoform X1 [Ciona intestinalis]|eukprot:XP_018670239.1 zinc finger protein isoform X1 [Ciona intestinalis]
MAEPLRNKRSQSDDLSEIPKAKISKTSVEETEENTASKKFEIEPEIVENQQNKSTISGQENKTVPVTPLETSEENSEPSTSKAKPEEAKEGFCFKCKLSYRDKNPLLLGCLHTFCSRCILTNEYFKLNAAPSTPNQPQKQPDGSQKPTTSTENHVGEENQKALPEEGCSSINDLKKHAYSNQISLSKLIVTCPQCGCNSQARVVTNNLFVLKEKDPTETTIRYCTNCEESAIAVRHCEECEEDLCEQCVTAHKRVKLTKEHILKSILDTELESAPNPHNYCSKHCTEQLKLFCETCNQLTCRDCQLEFHRDHKYQFVQEAANSLRKVMQTMSQKLDEKNAYLKQTTVNVKATLDKVNKRNEEVTQDVLKFHNQLQELITNKSQFFLRKIDDITTQRRNKLTTQLAMTDRLNRAVEHCISFINQAMDDRNGTALLHSKQVVMEYLTAVMRQKFGTNPASSNHLYFQSDPSILATITSKMGSLFWGYPAVNVQKQMETQNLSSPQRHTMHHRGIPPQSFQPANAGAQRKPEGMNHVQHPRNSTSLDKLLTSTSNAQSYYQNHQQKQQNDYTRRMEAQDSQQQLLRNQHMHGMKPTTPLHNQRPPVPQSSSHSRMPPHPPTTMHLPGYQSNSQYIRPTRVNMGMGQPQTSNINMNSNGRQDNYNQRRGGVNLNISPVNHSIPHQQPQQQQPQQQHQQQQHQQQQYNMGNMNRMKPFVSRASVANMKQTAVNHGPIERSHSHNAMHEHDPPTLHSPLKPNLTVTPPPHPSFMGEVASMVNNDVIPVLQMPTLNEKKQDPPHQSPESITHAVQSPSLSSADSGFETGLNRNNDQNNLPKPDTEDHLSPPPLLDFSELIKQEAIEEDEDMKYFDDKHETSVEEMVMSLAQEQQKEIPKTLTTPTTSPNTKAKMGETSHFSEWNNFTENNMRKYDPNEDWCGVCNNGGDLLCCDSCPKVFHVHCHVPEILAAPPGIWQCMLCRDLDAAVEMEMGPGKRKRVMGLQGKPLKLCERILLELFCHSKSSPFHFPVKNSVPNYYKLIKEPMDFLKIKKKLQPGNFQHYAGCEKFLSDVYLVFTNCYLFNGEDTSLGRAAKEVQKYFYERVQLWLPFLKLNLDRLEEDQRQIITEAVNKQVANEKPKPTSTDKSKPHIPYEHDSPWKPGQDETEEDDDVIESTPSSDVSEEQTDLTDESRRRKQSKSGIVHIK